MTDPDDQLDRRVASYRRTRTQIEREGLPLATFVAGASFTSHASLPSPELRAGA